MNDYSVSFAPEDRAFVYAVVLRIVGSVADAEDVTQEALLLAFRYRESFRGQARYRTWLYKIATTAALGHLRRRRRPLESATPLAEVFPDSSQSVEARLAEAEEQALLVRALERLPASYRQVLLTRLEVDEHEVADRLGISPVNAKVRAHRARRQLRVELDEIARAA